MPLKRTDPAFFDITRVIGSRSIIASARSRLIASGAASNAVRRFPFTV